MKNNKAVHKERTTVFDNKEIEKFLVRKGMQFVNNMKYTRARDPAGKLTNFMTGDRFSDISRISQIPKPPF